MDIIFEDNFIKFNKKLNNLDIFVLDFIDIFDRLDIKYVLLSGYVSILFGRNRSSEDIDVVIERLDFDKFKKFWKMTYKDFECINTEDVKEAYERYINANHAIRFSRKNEFLPNMEIKFPKLVTDFFPLEHSVKVMLNKKTLFISPIELQISFKVYLGSEKDVEDARYLYKLFKNHLNLEILNEWNKKLNIVEKFNKYIK